MGRYYDGNDSAIGYYFGIKFPTDWSEDEKYDFDWNQMNDEEKKFNRLLKV